MKIYDDLIVAKQTLKIPNYIQGQRNYLFQDKEFTYQSYFDSELGFVTANTPLSEIIKAIQASKKNVNLYAEISLETQIKNLKTLAQILALNVNQIAAIEAHFQGTSSLFQIQNAIKPLENKISKAIEMLEKEPLSLIPKSTVGVITPSPLSFFEIGHRIIFALFHRVPLIVKASRKMAISSLLWVEIIESLELPPGFIQFIQGEGATVGNFLAQHPGVIHLSFSGSYFTAKSLFSSFNPLDKKYQMYLGGKNAMVILTDFDFKKEIHNVIKPLINFAGKYSLALPRIYITDHMEKDFKATLKETLSSVRALTNVDQDFGFLPLNDQEKIRFHEETKKFIDQGAHQLFTTERIGVYSDLPNCSEWHHESSDLPLFNITSVKYQYEMQKWINNTPFGHSVVIFGNEEKVHKFANKIEVTNVWINPENMTHDFMAGDRSSGYGNLDLNLPSSFYSYKQKKH